jgi:hypothetical protein
MTARTRQVTEQIQQWLVRRLGTDNKYHPERHYMRGPGPKCMAKSALNKATANKSEPVKAIPKESKA